MNKKSTTKKMEQNHCKSMHVNKEVSMGQPYQVSFSALLGESACLGEFLNCLYSNTHSTGYKQEELEAFVLLLGYDLTGITDMWWHCS